MSYQYMLRLTIEPGFHEEEKLKSLYSFCREARIDDVMFLASGQPEPHPPGANRSRIEALFEKFDTLSPFVVEPTLTAVEMQAGELIPVALYSLPEEITVAVPSERRLSISLLVRASRESHIAESE